MNEKVTQSAASPSILRGEIAELVIDLTLALKNASTYGQEHPSALKSLEALVEKLHELFRDRNELTLQFTGTLIIFEESHLDRANPIYRHASELLSSLGIASLTFYPGSNKQECAAFISSIITARRRKKTPGETEILLAEAELKHIEIGFLRDMLKFEERELVQIKGRTQAESLWDEYLAGLEQGSVIKTPLRGASGARSSKPEPRPEADKDRYASAIVEYLRSLEESREGLVELGQLGQLGPPNKIHSFVESLNDDLRKQLLASTLRSDDLEPETVRVFAETLGEKFVIEGIQQLNDENREIPMGLFRSLSMLSFLQPARSGTEAATLPSTESTHRKLLERLLAEDHRFSYVSADYEAKMQALQEFVGARAGSEIKSDGDQQIFTDFDVEDHFLKTTSNLLAGAADDTGVTKAVFQAAGDSLNFFLDHKVSSRYQEAIDLANRAQAAAAELEGGISKWKRSSLLDRLARDINGSNLDSALDARDCFTWIGEAAVPRMLEALAQTESLSTRRRILSAILKMEPFPSAALLPVLHHREPWYLQRNTLWLFREHQNTEAADAALALWTKAAVRVRAEIIEYLRAISHAECSRLVRSALFDRSRWLTLKVARSLSYSKDHKELEDLVRRMESLPRWQVGSKFHIALLRCLAQSGDPRVHTYLSFVRGSSRPLLPVQRRRLLEATDRLSSSLRVSNE